MALVMPTGHSLVEYDYEIKLGQSTTHISEFLDDSNMRMTNTWQSPYARRSDYYMYSMVDWESIYNDGKIIKQSLQCDHAEAAKALGENAVRFDTREEQDAWQKELDGLLKMLEPRQV